MRLRSKLLLASLTAALALCVAVASSSANRLSLSERGFRFTWTPITFIYEISEAHRANCNLTLDGSFHSSTFPKAPGTLIGSITRTSISTCGITVLTETLPWHIRYDAFVGRLPTIGELKVSFTGVALRVNEFGCLAFSTVELPMRWLLEISRGAVGRVTADPTIGLLARGLCESENFRYQGVATLTRPSSTTAIAVTLI